MALFTSNHALFPVNVLLKPVQWELLWVAKWVWHFFLLFQTYWNLDSLDIPEENPNPAGMISQAWMIPFPQANMHLLTHTQSITITKSQSHIIRLLWEEKHGFCLVMFMSYLYHMKLYYVQLLGGPICEVCRLLAPRVRPCGGSVAAGRHAKNKTHRGGFTAEGPDCWVPNSKTY